MEISELTLKLILILIPGVIASIIINKLTIHDPWKPFNFILNAIILGVFSYLLLQLIENLFVVINNIRLPTPKPFIPLKVWITITDSTFIPYTDIIYSSVCALVIGIIGTLMEHYDLLHRLGRKLNLTNKYGSLNLFSEFLNNKDTQWVTVRDYKNNLAYFGYVSTFSETNKISELVLCDVSVSTCDECSPLYELDEIYLSFAKSDIIIEKNKLKVDVKKELPDTETNKN